jgi:hypothetical protein
MTNIKNRAGKLDGLIGESRGPLNPLILVKEPKIKLENIAVDNSLQY